MSWKGEAASVDGVDERDFSLAVAGHQVPGVYWAPAGGADRLVMLGHGGTTHKRIDYIVEVAHLLCARGIAAMAIDGPGHGERKKFEWTGEKTEFARAWEDGGGTETVMADWRAALDFIESEVDACPTGWWGTGPWVRMMGLPVTATEDRVKVALLGLMGNWGPQW